MVSVEWGVVVPWMVRRIVDCPSSARSAGVGGPEVGAVSGYFDMFAVPSEGLLLCWCESVVRCVGRRHDEIRQVESGIADALIFTYECSVAEGFVIDHGSARRCLFRFCIGEDINV